VFYLLYIFFFDIYTHVCLFTFFHSGLYFILPFCFYFLHSGPFYHFSSLGTFYFFIPYCCILSSFFAIISLLLSSSFLSLFPLSRSYFLFPFFPSLFFSFFCLPSSFYSLPGLGSCIPVYCLPIGDNSLV
jgi:hypothetical protein